MNNLKDESLLPNSNSKNGWIALFGLFFGLFLTFAAIYYIHKDEERQRYQEFFLICQEIKSKIETSLHAHSQLLRSGAAVFSVSDSISRSDWRDFIKNNRIEKNLPGIQGVGFAAIIPKSQLYQHIQSVRNESKQNPFLKEYTINPAVEREVYTSIVYLEPVDFRNERAFGYDMFSESVRRSAMERARDYDMASLSGKVSLIQETGEDFQFGTLMYVPVYLKDKSIETVEERREAIQGWVYSPYRMADLMKGILGRWHIMNNERIHLEVYDGDNLTDSLLLFSSQTRTNIRIAHRRYRTAILPIEFNKKEWTLYFNQSQNLNALTNSKVTIVLISGILISFLLFFLFYRCLKLNLNRKYLNNLATIYKRVKIS